MALIFNQGNNPMSYWVLGYGYQWWIPQNPEGDFLAVGVAGQYIYVHPAHNLVIAKSSAYGDYKERWQRQGSSNHRNVPSDSEEHGKRGESESCMIKTGQKIHTPTDRYRHL
jgi:CubicO group peptidase (beta-lactamase class C family)